MYLLSVIDSDKLIEAIEQEKERLGHYPDNKELNILVNRLITEGKAQLVHAQEKALDVDLLAGNLREEGCKVLNMGEEIRRKNEPPRAS
jgi:hypothetical protein